MHIKNNVFENIFNTIIDIKGKTKDNIKARMNIALFYDHQNNELFNDGYMSQNLKLYIKKKNTVYCLQIP
jgi:hypothetical protein